MIEGKLYFGNLQENGNTTAEENTGNNEINEALDEYCTEFSKPKDKRYQYTLF